MSAMSLTTVITLIKATRQEAEDAAKSARELGFSVDMRQDRIRGGWICTCTKPVTPLQLAELPDAVA